MPNEEHTNIFDKRFCWRFVEPPINEQFINRHFEVQKVHFKDNSIRNIDWSTANEIYK